MTWIIALRVGGGVTEGDVAWDLRTTDLHSVPGPLRLSGPARPGQRVHVCVHVHAAGRVRASEGVTLIR